MEHWVTITIPELDEARTLSIFDALVRQQPNVAPVMDRALPSGPTHYTLGLDADDAPSASTAAVAIFRNAVEALGVTDARATTIVNLHAELAPEPELEEPGPLQPA
jgi:hypothetical protein